MKRVITTLTVMAMALSIYNSAWAIPITVGGHKYDSTYEIDFTSHVGNTWTYQVTELGGKDLSHWLLGIGECLTVTDGSPSGYEVGIDGSTGYYGIKWDVHKSFDSGSFSFTLDDDYCEGTIQALVKAGKNYATGDIIGPTCQSQPPSTPEPTTMCLVVLGILGLLGIGIRQRRKEK